MASVRTRTARSPVGFGATVDSRIAPDVLSLVRQYHAQITDGYNPGGSHASDGDHPKGLAVDIVPGAGGSWAMVNQLAAFAASRPDIFRFVGYDGRFGTTKWPGHGEGQHLHLSWHGGGTAGDTAPLKTLSRTRGTVSRPRNTTTGGTPADWLKEAGWPSNLIPTMTAIGGAESGWNIGAESPPNTNGTKDFGWLQVNSVHGYDQTKLTTDPVYTARVAYQIYKSQGLGAWSTYNNGAYKSFLGKTPDVQPGKTRPGGEGDTGDTGGSGGGSDVDTELVAFWNTPVLPGGIPNPLALFGNVGGTIKDGKDFLKWIAWIFHPLNLLRIVEFWAGFNFIIMGFIAILVSWKGASAEDVASLVPAGRAVKLAKTAKGAQTAKKGARAAKGAKAAQTARKAPRTGTGELSVA